MEFVPLGKLLTESKIESTNPNSDKRIRVKLNVKGVEKRPLAKDLRGATKYYVRKKGQFIYGKQNLFKGAFGVVPEELDNFESSSDLPAFDVDFSCNPEWIYYYFKQNKFYESLVQYATGTGSRRIQPARLFEVRIPLPNINIQNQIIAKFKKQESVYGELQLNLVSDDDLIIKLRQSILSEAVQGKLVPQDPNDEPASVLLEKIKKEKEKLIKENKIKKEKPLPPISEDKIPYKLPKSWEWVRVTNISLPMENLDIHSEFKADEIINYVDIDSVDSKRHEILKPKRSTVDKLSSRARRILNKGDIIYSLVRPYLQNIAIINLDMQNLIGTTGLFVIKPMGVDRKYLFYYLLSPYILEKHKEALKGFNSPGINVSYFEKELIPLPSLNEQKRIVEKVDQLRKLCDELEEQVKENQKNSEFLMESVLREAFEV